LNAKEHPEALQSKLFQLTRNALIFSGQIDEKAKKLALV